MCPFNWCGLGASSIGGDHPSCATYVRYVYSTLVAVPIVKSVGKSGFVSQTKHTVEATNNKHGSISFMIDNIQYVNFKI